MRPDDKRCDCVAVQAGDGDVVALLGSDWNFVLPLPVPDAEFYAV